MNDETPQPAFANARAKKQNRRRSIWLNGLMGLAIGGALASATGYGLGYLDAHFDRAINESIMPWVLMGLLFLGMIATFWWTGRYWQSIDEMARRAHLDAFFWGGGMISWAMFLPIIGPMLAFPDVKFDVIENLEGTLTHAFGLGATTAVLLTCLGYGIFWLAWWAKRR